MPIQPINQGLGTRKKPKDGQNHDHVSPQGNMNPMQRNANQMGNRMPASPPHMPHKKKKMSLGKKALIASFAGGGGILGFISSIV